MSLPPKTRLYLGYLCATLAGYVLVAGILLYALVPLKWIILIVAGLLGLALLAVAVSWLLPLSVDGMLQNPGREILQEEDRKLLAMALSEHPSQADLDTFLAGWDIEAAPIQSVMLMAYLMQSRPDLAFPAAITPRLGGVLRFCRFQNLKRFAHLSRFGGELNRQKIPFVVLKGGAMKVYRPDFPRWMGDIDLLVREQDFDRAEQAGIDLGYYPVRVRHSTDLHPSGDLKEGLLDLHKYLEMNTGKEMAYSGLLLQRSSPCTMFTVQGLLPVPEDMVFISLVNLFKNFAERNSMESVLTAFFDIGFLVRTKEDFDWTLVRENIRLTGTEFQVWLVARFLSGIVKGILPESFLEERFSRREAKRRCVSLLYDRDVLAPFRKKALDFDLYVAIDSHRPLLHLLRSRRIGLFLLLHLRKLPGWERLALKYRYALGGAAMK